jgi:hypothetical protein
LVRSCMAEDNLQDLQAHVEVLWSFLREGGGGTEFPLMAYEACARAFDRLQDGNLASAAAEAGYAMLMDLAGKISDPAWRESFLQNIEEHRALVERQAASPPGRAHG